MTPSDHVTRITQKTGFMISKERNRRLLYGNEILFIVYEGIWSGKPALLKIQYRKPSFDEGRAIQSFTTQNKSSLVRAPQLFVFVPWNKDLGYGYVVMEEIKGAQPIFLLPLATRADMERYATFYQLYRTQAALTPWIPQKPETMDSLTFTLGRIQKWKGVADTAQLVPPQHYNLRIERFNKIATHLFPQVPMVFCNGHLTANGDVMRMPDGGFVITEHGFWGYRPRWYDLSFVIWSSLLQIRDDTYTFKQMKSYVEEWTSVFSEIPITKTDPNFRRNFLLMMLERTLGSILVDFSHESWREQKNALYHGRLLVLHLKLFDYLAEIIEQS